MARQMRRPADVRLETQRTTTARGVRNPRFDAFHGDMIDSILYPIALAPVLAGDTIKNASWMGRILRDNTDSQVVGMWFESWLFYVRIGDMASAEAMRDAIVDPNSAGTFDWREEAMQAIWAGYFKDETDAGTWNDYDARLRPVTTNWWDSAIAESLLPPEDTVGGAWSTQWDRYQAMRRAKLTVKTFEEYLAAQGVAVPPQLRAEHDPELKKPELVHYAREFAYPQPAGFGADTSEVYRTTWFIQERTQRARFCAEPGLVVLCTAIRPKAYYEHVFEPLDYLNDAAGWLPPEFETDPHTSLVEIPASNFGDTVPGAAAVVDIRDYYLFGDQRVIAGTPPYREALTYNPRSVIGANGSKADFTLSLAIASRISRDTTS